MLHTSTALCLVDFLAPAVQPPPPRTGAQRRADRRARRAPDEGVGCKPGDNFRVLPLDNPCLHASYLSPVTALLVRLLWLALTVPAWLVRSCPRALLLGFC